MPLLPRPGEGEVSGYSYAGVFVRAAREDVLGQLIGLRFSGWVGPQEGDWVVAVPVAERGRVAAGGLDVDALGATLARRLDEVALAVSVHEDRLLRIAACSGSHHIGSYLSNPAFEASDRDDVFPDPEGVDHAEAFAAACGRPEASDDLSELLADVLDEESEIESERLSAALRLLGLPAWLVAATVLPKDVPSGPRPGEFTRLGAGRTGVGGRAEGWLVEIIRRRRSGRRG